MSDPTEDRTDEELTEIDRLKLIDWVLDAMKLSAKEYFYDAVAAWQIGGTDGLKDFRRVCKDAGVDDDKVDHLWAMLMGVSPMGTYWLPL